MRPPWGQRRTVAAQPNPEGSGPETVYFVEYALPVIDSGIYQIIATQEVVETSSGETLDTFTSTQEFAIAGPRSQLPPGTVNSVFPAANSQGDFSTVLPHVVFNNATLPWQRITGATDQKAPGPLSTWLGVLLFDTLDPPPTLVTGTKNDLVSPPSGTFFPGYALEPGESLADPVTFVDVPFDLFAAICPSVNDLGWLAHVRAVQASNKPSHPSFPPLDTDGLGSYSVVFGSRLPAAGRDSTVMLVSLEDYAAYLPDDQGTPSTGFPAPLPSFIRLIVLTSWSFYALQQVADFEAIVSALSIAPGGVQLPVRTALTSNGAADSFAAGALSNGYTALLETLPDGTETVSWYRGPLLPYGTVPAFITPPYPGPDGLRRFDPDTGLFDVSYAAAWQLGQLLALQSGTFSAALYRWTLSELGAAAATQQADALRAHLPLLLDDAPAASIDTVLRHVVAPAADAVAALHKTTPS